MYKAKINNKEFEITFKGNSNKTGEVSGNAFNIDILKKNNKSFHILSKNKSFNINILDVNYETKIVNLRINSNTYEVEIKDDLDELLNKMGIKNQNIKIEKELKSPMPGLITNILVNIGDTVKKGDNLLILEAMKMENNLKAENDGIVKDIVVTKGNSVEKKQVLIIFE